MNIFILLEYSIMKIKNVQKSLIRHYLLLLHTLRYLVKKNNDRNPDRCFKLLLTATAYCRCLMQLFFYISLFNLSNNWDLGTAPTDLSAISPFLRNKIVGMLRI